MAISTPSLPGNSRMRAQPSYRELITAVGIVTTILTGVQTFPRASPIAKFLGPSPSCRPLRSLQEASAAPQRPADRMQPFARFPALPQFGAFGCRNHRPALFSPHRHRSTSSYRVTCCADRLRSLREAVSPVSSAPDSARRGRQAAEAEAKLGPACRSSTWLIRTTSSR